VFACGIKDEGYTVNTGSALGLPVDVWGIKFDCNILIIVLVIHL